MENLGIILVLLNVLTLIWAKSPPPITCNASGCTVSNYLGIWPDRTPCRAATVVYPGTEQELVIAIAGGVRAKQKIKVVSKWSQSISKFACPGGNEGLLISTRDLNTQIIVDPGTMTVACDAGVLLTDLLYSISEAGYALAAATYWGAVSVAGALSTGAHGSRLWGKGGALHDHVVAISLVIPATKEQGYARVVRLVEGQDGDDGFSLLDAAKVSLGVLGAISKVVFKVEPMFKRSVILELMEDDRIEEQILEIAEHYEFGDVCWHPSLAKLLLKMDVRVPVDTPGEGVNKYRGFQAMPLSSVLTSRLAEEKMQSERNVSSMCNLSRMVLNSRLPSGNGYLNDGVNFTGFPVIGFNHHMQTARGCEDATTPGELIGHVLDNDCTGEACDWNQGGLTLTTKYGLDEAKHEMCSWDPRVNGLFFHQIAFSLPLDKAKAFILDIKKLRDMDTSSMCGLSIYGGIYLRFVQESTAYLGQRDPAIEFDFTFYRSRDGQSGNVNEDVIQEIEQMALVKYQGKPHWGKNRNLAFQSMRDRVKDMDKFLEAKKQLDPQGYFSSEWSDAVLGGHIDDILHTNDHCALEGMCICSEDRHCAPEQGYFCEAGRLFAAARVCRYSKFS